MEYITVACIWDTMFTDIIIIIPIACCESIIHPLNIILKLEVGVTIDP